MAYTRVNWENYPSTNTPRNATNLNVMDEGLFNQDARITVNEIKINNIQTGWNLANETWTYSSVDDPTGVITISGDKTTKYSLGMRIKFTNNSNIIYGIITAISYSSPNTTLTFLHEINPSNSQALHLMQNSAITANYYSNMKVPYGFPINKENWTIKVLSSELVGQDNPTINTFYNLGGLSITIPIGLFKVKIFADLQSNDSGGTKVLQPQLTLSTNTSSITDSRFNGGFYAMDVSTFSQNITKEFIINNTAKTIYYLLARTIFFASSNIYFRGDNNTTILSAECAYL